MVVERPPERMAPEIAEVEVKLAAPVHRIWSAANQIQVLMPQILPDVFSSCDLEQGDGGPGSVRVYHCGPGTPRSIDRVFRPRSRIPFSDLAFDEAVLLMLDLLLCGNTIAALTLGV